jgi:hypothetical protein
MKTVSTNLIESFLDWLNRLPEGDVANLNSGKSKIVFALDQQKQKSRGKVSHGPVDINALLDQLNQASDRETGKVILADEAIDKSTLLALCKRLDLPSSTKDNIPSLQEKIIEQTIGYRLRSRAIRGQ